MNHIPSGADIQMITGDIVLSDSGDLNIVSEDRNIIQSCNHMIFLRFGENEFHPDLGNRAHGKRMKLNVSGMEEIKNDCMNAMLLNHRIKDVVEINVVPMGDHDCRIDYKVRKHDDNIISSTVNITIRR